MEETLSEAPAPGRRPGFEPGAGWPAPAFPHLPSERSGRRRSLLDEGHEAALERDGFVVVPFLDPAEVAALRRAYLELGPAPGDPQTGFHQGNTSPSLDWKQAASSQVGPMVAAAIERTFDRHHAYLTTYLVKWPGDDGRLPPHTDPTMILDEGWARGLTAWCVLEPLSTADGEDRGALRAVPGSHRLEHGRWHRAIGGHVPSVLDQLDLTDWEAHGVRVEAQPGDAVIFDHRLVHWSHPNRSATPRVVVGLALRPEELPNVSVECDATGEVVVYEVDDQHFLEEPPVGAHAHRELHRDRLRPTRPVRIVDLERLAGRSGWGDRVRRALARRR